MQLFKKATTSVLIASLALSSPALATTTYSDLPEIGTAAAGTLTVEKEIEYGDAYMRMLRSSQPIVNDPLLSEYVTGLGNSLVANANDVKTPFEFFLIRNRDINAFAFFGGHVALHTGLFLHAKTESELASVVAHEIAHLTQRHLARAMEEQARQTPLTIAAMVGSLMLAIAAPQAGIAAVQATTAASIQGRINYTRSNEKEADRIGIETLSRSGYDVNAMPRFFTRLSDQYRYASKPPSFLLTHPLPDDRITDTRARAEQYPKHSVPMSPTYQLARARVIARFAGIDSNASLDWFERTLKKASPAEAQSLNYGKALVYIDTRQFDKAAALLNPLFAAQPNNRFYLDAMTDLDVAQKQFAPALARLNKALDTQPNNPVLLLNRDYVLVKAEKYKDAIIGLERYTHRHPTDVNGWSMLQEAYEHSGDQAGGLAAQGELYALQARWHKAIANYTQASQLVDLGSLDQARYDARIDQLRVEEARFSALQ
ncbi:M48 family metallopeptidase [Enterovibrio sp. ZSDZ35]|uniref:Putative beta-barrel assembly-enhancing protease n=1 Tax=Enterovibrio qingdaonensis TaxID=2899818 RepID=A0ABT5QT38_9GAMM|nr:M48 family metallopeptidase [Enterovibrio sp. ZSDZ35]MDD1784146.1 M48 family metallopeptidase [Enterovibrio sp. ZSDZ35]